MLKYVSSTVSRSIATAVVAIALLAPLGAEAQRGVLRYETCTVQVLNQTVHVREDSTWVLPNIPTNGGQVRARLNCESVFGTRSGQSDFFVIQGNQMNAVPIIDFGTPDPGPTRIDITSPVALFTELDETAQLAVIGTYAAGADGVAPEKNLSAETDGTNYLTTNEDVLSVSPGGLVTARDSGTVVITAWNQGQTSVIWLSVKIGDDTDEDGLPDNYELAVGLDPTNPLDALADSDADGLSNLQEFDYGTDPFGSDTDGDGIGDGEEVTEGSDAWVTNPLLADGDGDGLPDPVEILTGTDPNDAQSADFDAALVGLDAQPASLTLFYNPILGEVSKQLRIRGLLVDGTAIELTNHPLMGFSSDDISVASFGATPGEVFGGLAGKTTVSASIATHSVDVPVEIKTFSPLPRAAMKLDCNAADVALLGDYALVACLTAGLHVVNVSTPTAPYVTGVAYVPTARAVAGGPGGVAWVASGTGVRAVGSLDTDLPEVLGSAEAGGSALGVAVRSAVTGQVLVAVATPSGVALFDGADPSAPTLLGVAAGSYSDVVIGGDTVAAISAKKVVLIDVTDPTAPLVGGTASGISDARRLAMAAGGLHVLVARGNKGMGVIDSSTVAGPVVVGALGPPAFMLNDVAVQGPLAMGADYYRVNSVPLVQVTVPSAPIFAGVVEFSKYNDANGVAIDAGLELVAMIGSGNWLFIGQYATAADDFGIPPVCVITDPDGASEQITGAKRPVKVQALDDVLVASVTVTLDGVPVGSTETPPYQVTVPYPKDLDQHVIEATAVDIGGNVGVCDPVAVQLIPDPLTNVIGKVIDQKGAPIGGADVSAVGDVVVTKTEADGSFLLVGAPTAQPLYLGVMGSVGPDILFDTFGPYEPVPKGTTSTGVLMLKTPVGSHTVAGLVATPVPYFTTQPTAGDSLAMGALVAKPVTYYLTEGTPSGPEPAMGALIAQPVPFVVRDSSYFPGFPLGAVIAAPVAYTRGLWLQSVSPAQVGQTDGQTILVLAGFELDDVVDVLFYVDGEESALLLTTDLAASGGGTQLDVTVSIDPTAPTGVWSVVLVSATLGSTPSSAGANNSFEVIP